ncbi:MAG: hypothetical protein CO030_00220 [Candidatus Magasanikbacteria bacterium CG_4_9_14_0_2_um_filter_42_11]|uniref:Uncharacterized protein n=1 Tax=Candidatus Magasanikbacteria bacterium CG_4_9_14_0_2_um_filter_42_11 TaxID=1974643 RepID=A0A2M8FB55_9BACT|nr:MAG: hypothetical protein COU34_03695 [Candidatus Magasanikbacteria bacterium CG10_big_fil_rev_8_21_14_0_10_43_9]PIY92099.1 MAG: hypothetical protein COY70_05110 [Candidatus Magasanikbacteria bacterium CG_4_10_14_0_8_um_filter_42_12]PJC52960.1 MAG: hypothetical protein CO030_00220 [Candidatus Magasanikbacteria bacterium CG_4_9_14_0_2_um_filter_42_11]
MKKLLILSTMLVILGVGCGNATSDTTTSTDTSSTTHDVIKKPGGVEPLDYAIEACQNNGYEIILRYNADTKNTETFCQFTGGYACEAISYITGTCTTTSTNRAYLVTTDGMQQNIRTCGSEEVPVCGVDSITYVNSCIAGLQRVQVKHTGVCTKEEQEAAAGTTNAGGTTSAGSSGSSASQGSSGTGTATAPTNVNTAWLGHLSAIAAGKNSGSKGPVKEECVYDTTRVYYMVESCPNCFSTLYNTNGDVICHPHNDIANECPSYFNKDSRSGNCKRI